MFSPTNSRRRFRLGSRNWFLFSLCIVAWCSSIQAQGVPTIVRVEEDWTLNVTSPEQGIVAPQVQTVISPQGDTTAYFAALAVNYRGIPEFAGGGLQLQIWNNEMPEKYTNYSNDLMLNYMEAQETITWTQVMEIKDGQLTFSIINGNSQTWGKFGGSEDLRASVPTSLPHLNHYDPTVSVKNSGISYAANRVKALTLTKVRYITAGGQTYEDAAPKVVYPPAVEP